MSTAAVASTASEPAPAPDSDADVIKQLESKEPTKELAAVIPSTNENETPTSGTNKPYQWFVKDRLVLVSIIVVSGENWSVVDDQMQQYAEAVVQIEQDDDEEVWRPEDWWNHESCAKEYNRLLEEYKTQAPDTSADPAKSQSLALAEMILRKLESEREAELDAEIQREILAFKGGLDDIRRMEAGDYGHIMEVIDENEEFKRFMIAEGLEETLKQAEEDFTRYRNMTPEEREAASKAAAKLKSDAAALSTLKVDTEGSMGPPASVPGGSGLSHGPSSPKVSPQLKNLVYTKIAGTTEDDVGNFPAPASSPTLSMLLEMPPRGHGQPLPEIPTMHQRELEATPTRTTSAVSETEFGGKAETNLVGGRQHEVDLDKERGIDIKIEGNVQISPLKQPHGGEIETPVGEEHEPSKNSAKVDHLVPCSSESLIKAVPETDGSLVAVGSAGEASTSDTETTITGSITPPSQRGTSSVLGSPTLGTSPTTPSLRVTRRHAAGTSEPGANVDEGKSLRGRTIVPAPAVAVKEEVASTSKEKVRIKLEFDSNTKMLKKPAPVDFKTVAMKEKEHEGRDLRSRRSGVAASGNTTPKPIAAKKKDTSDDEDEFVDAQSDLTPVVGSRGDELEESTARATATERWVEGSGSGTTTSPQKPTNTSAGVEGPPALAGMKNRRGDSSEERSGTDKEGEEKRITRARTRTGPTAGSSTSTTMTPPPTLIPASGSGSHASAGGIKQEHQSRSTPEPEATPASALSRARALRSRQRGPDGTEPASPAPFSYSTSTPHSPASSTTTTTSILHDDSAYGSSVGPEDKNMKRALLSLHRLVTNLKNAYIFLKTSVPKYSKPRFDEFIRRPLDFTAIKRSIESDSIRSFDAYQKQVCIMFMNHLMYFHEGHDLHRQTQQMANETFDIIEDFIRNYNESNAPRRHGGGGGGTSSGTGTKREGRSKLRHSYSVTTNSSSIGAKKGTPTPSVAGSNVGGGGKSGSEESHDESAGLGGRTSAPGTGAGPGRGRRKKRVELSPNITDEPRTRTPRANTRHSAV